ncbi:MAG: YceI family protein [Solirubrobacteraceae bacterium]
MSRPTPVAAIAAAVTTGRWRLDPVRSVVEFRVPHLYGLITVVGHFERYAGTLDMSAAPAIELTIDAASLTSTHHGDREATEQKRDAHLRSSDFFDVEHHPTVRFASEAARLDGRGLFVRGLLSAGGRTIPLEVTATLESADDELEIHASARANQRDLGMTYSPLGTIRTPSKLIVKGRLVRDANRSSRSDLSASEAAR